MNRTTLLCLLAPIATLAPAASAGGPALGGSISADPNIDQRIWPLLVAKYDTNGDRDITGMEYTNMWNDMQSESLGDDGYTEVTKPELASLLSCAGFSDHEASKLACDIIDNKRYDRNGDGVLDSSEWGKFWRDLTPHRDIGGPIIIAGVFIPTPPLFVIPL